AAKAAFDTIFPGNPSRSALEARASGILQADSQIVMNRSHLIGAAKVRALQLVQNGFSAPEPALITVAGKFGWQALMAVVEAEKAAGRLSETDVRLASALLS